MARSRDALLTRLCQGREDRLVFLLALWVVAALGISGCSSTVGPVIRDQITQVGKTGTISLGDDIYVHRKCPCWHSYEALKPIAINGRNAIPAHSVWIVRVDDPLTGRVLLDNQAILQDDDHAVQLVNGELVPDAAVIQFKGVRKGRKWALRSPNDVNGFRDIGWQPWDWRVQFLGTDKNNPNVLRFSIQDNLSASSGENIGQAEYDQNYREQPEFVVRGVRFKVVNVTNDGQMTFEILEERDKNQE